jgi:D-alanine-D-alanine ligase
MGKPRVLVVFGGMSSEHGVSCLTAGGVLAAIDGERYDTVAVGIAPDGQWFFADPAAVMNYRPTAAGLPVVDSSQPPALLYRDGAVVKLGQLNGSEITRPVTVDVALTLLHGPFGEDGTIQGWFEMLGLRYVGANVLASAVCMDKITMNRVLQAAGLPIGPFVAIDDWAWRTEPKQCLDQVGQLTFPVFVKPARGGSSIGISRVEQLDQVTAAIELARQHDPRVIVEEGVPVLQEVECGVLVNRRTEGAQASLPGQIRVNTATGFYDFDRKYLDTEAVELIVPTPLAPELTAEVQRLSLAACQALDVEGLARVDSFITPDHQVVINEVNTMPGFTSSSLFPRMWQASGLSYPALLSYLLEEALSRPLGLR